MVLKKIEVSAIQTRVYWQHDGDEEDVEDDDVYVRTTVVKKRKTSIGLAMTTMMKTITSC